MKLLSIIFCVYILSLLAYPCQDEICVAHTSHAEKSSPHNHHEKDCHTCSPFCVCNCCHTNTNVALNAVSINVELPLAFIINTYKESPIKDISLSIWQPPKI